MRWLIELRGFRFGGKGLEGQDDDDLSTGFARANFESAAELADTLFHAADADAGFGCGHFALLVGSNPFAGVANFELHCAVGAGQKDGSMAASRVTVYVSETFLHDAEGGPGLRAS